ncbi:Gustatory receptor 74a [Hyalella azteca]|uniref:Gustatory receptor 74a n=1 Tax=Hyalella azteca TaxID=294128 RepID=A0A6A0GQ99_HYAAZ|nr:uncharacterized protein LOC108666463 [Hyalella azteca]KAA0184314.1 Gustatory receptor 74a [Hyalella azteca]
MELVKNYTMKKWMIWQFRFLRILGLAPFAWVNGKYRTSQVYLGFSVSLQIFLTILSMSEIIKSFYNASHPQLLSSSSNIYNVIQITWGPAHHFFTMIIAWHFLLSRNRVLKIVQFFRSSSCSLLAVDYSQHLLALLIAIITGYTADSTFQLSGCYEKSRTDNISCILYVVGWCVKFVSGLVLSFCFNSSMKTLSLELKNVVVKIVHESHPVKYQLSAMKIADVIPSSLPEMKKKVAVMRRTIYNIHHSFSVVAFGILAYEQLEMVLVVLHAIFFAHSKVPHVQTFLITVAASVPLWLVLDSQTAYIKTCEDGIHRVKKLIAEVGLKGSEHVQEVWHLRGIQAELERMPRFTIFGLFELGRHCLLSMGSIVLTYVIIAIQFTTSNNPVTCKPFNFTDGSTSA